MPNNDDVIYELTMLFKSNGIDVAENPDEATTGRRLRVFADGNHEEEWFAVNVPESPAVDEEEPEEPPITSEEPLKAPIEQQGPAEPLRPGEQLEPEPKP